MCQLSYNYVLIAVNIRQYCVTLLDIWTRAGKAASASPHEPRSDRLARLAIATMPKSQLCGTKAVSLTMICTGLLYLPRPLAELLPAQRLLARCAGPRRKAWKFHPTAARSGRSAPVIRSAISKRGAGRSAGNGSSKHVACRKRIAVDLSGEVPRAALAWESGPSLCSSTGSRVPMVIEPVCPAAAAHGSTQHL